MINYAILALVLGTIPFILLNPFMGVLAWHWVGIMNPHRMAWGFASGLPVAMIIGIPMLIAFALSREPKRLPMNAITVLLGLFALWMTITTVFSLVPNSAWSYWEQLVKILLMTFVTMALLTSRERIHALVWVIVISLGFFALKGGVFTIINGGEHRVWGPAGSFIGSSNALALALVMTLPLIRYLQLHTEQRILRLGLGCLLIVAVFSVVGSYSRGGVLALAVMGVAFALGSRHRVRMAVTAVALALVISSFAADHWVERMGTIETYEDDKSAMQRINVWEGTFQMALDQPILGFGFLHFVNENHYFQYVPDDSRTRSAHSIYFQVLGEHSWIGLGLFLAIGIIAALRCGRIMRLARGDPEKQWAYDLAQMSRLSLVGYASAGTFLNLAYFDLYYTLLALVVATEGMLMESHSSAPRSARNRAARPTVRQVRAAPSESGEAVAVTKIDASNR